MGLSHPAEDVSIKNNPRISLSGMKQEEVCRLGANPSHPDQVVEGAGGQIQIQNSQVGIVDPFVLPDFQVTQTEVELFVAFQARQKTKRGFVGL